MIRPNLLNDFWRDSFNKQIEIRIDNEVLDNSLLWQESLSIEESICSEEFLVFGSCESNVAKFKTADISRSFKGKTIVISMYIDKDNTKKVELGTYKVFSESLSNDKRYKDIVAYDKFYELSTLNIIDWYNSLSFPMTLGEFRTLLFSRLGVTQQSVTLINDTLSVDKTIATDDLKALDVIKSICEINGVFGNISRTNVFEYVSLPFAKSADISPSYYIEGEVQDYNTKTISKLHIAEKEGDIGISVGNGDNVYKVEGNFLLYGLDDEQLQIVADNLFNKIKSYTYRPFTMKLKGNPCITCGDMLHVVTKRGFEFDTYLLSRSLSGIQALYDDFKAQGQEIYEDNINPIKNDIKQLKGRSNVLERSIEENRLTITDVEKNLQNQITQTVGEFDVKISSLQQQIDNEVVVWEVTEEPTLDNYPAVDWTYNVVTDGTLQLEDGIPFIYTEEEYRKHSNNVAFDTVTNLTYKFRKTSAGWGWQLDTSSDFGYALAQISELRVTTTDISTLVQEIETDIQENYYTKNEVQSYVVQTKDSIEQNIQANYATIAYAEGKASEAESNAKADTTEKLKLYSTTETMNSTIKQNLDEISQTIQKNQTKFVYPDGYDRNNTLIGNGYPSQEVVDGTYLKYLDIDTGSYYSRNSKSELFVLQGTAELTMTNIEVKIVNNGNSILQSVSENYYDKSATQTIADTAQTNAIADTVSRLKSYSTTSEMNSAIQQNTNSILSTVSNSYSTKVEAQGYADDAKADAILEAETLADNAKSDAIADTDNKLMSYSTTTEMNSAIEQKANEITLSVSESYETKSDASYNYQELSNEITQATDRFTVKIEGVEKTLEDGRPTFESVGTPTLKNYPAYDFTNNVKLDGSLQLGSGIPFVYTDESYDEHLYSLAFPKGTKDTYSFVKDNDSYYWRKLENSYYGITHNQIAELNVGFDEIAMAIEEVKEDYTTKEYVRNELKLTKEGIEGGVEKTLESYSTTEEVESIIKVTTEENSMTLNKNQTKWVLPEGYTEENTYFGNGAPNSYASESDYLRYLDIDSGSYYIRTSKTKTFGIVGIAVKTREEISNEIKMTTDEISLAINKNQTEWVLPDGWTKDNTYFGNGVPSDVAKKSNKLKYLNVDNGWYYTRSIANVNTDFTKGGECIPYDTEIDTRISMTEDSIIQTVQRNQTKWTLPNGFTESNTHFGNGAPVNSATYDKLYYLDVNSGNYYVRNSKTVPFPTTPTGKATSTRDSISTEISQAEGNVLLAANNTAQGYANTAQSNAESKAKGYADTAESNAKSDTTEKLKSYSTTIEMNSAIELSANGIKQTVNKNVSKYVLPNGYTTSNTFFGNGAPNDYVKSTTFTKYLNLDNGDYYDRPNSNATTNFTKRGTATLEYDTLSSRITQTESSITTMVSDGYVSSKISQEAGDISISANRISITSDKFSLSKDGVIAATSGTVGGWSIKPGGIKKDYYNNNVHREISLQADGTICCNIDGELKWALQNDGTVYSKNVYVDGGSIHGTAFYQETLTDSLSIVNASISGGYIGEEKNIIDFSNRTNNVSTMAIIGDNGVRISANKFYIGTSNPASAWKTLNYLDVNNTNNSIFVKLDCYQNGVYLGKRDFTILHGIIISNGTGFEY